MTEDEDYDALSQKHLASTKRDMRISLEDAAVRATHKVMAELEYERGFVDGMQEQMRSSVDKAVNRTARSKREWVGLTYGDIWQAVNDCTFAGDLHADKFARAIEAKLKEKNT